MRILLVAVFVLFSIFTVFAQPPVEPGVSQELAKWRAAHYSDVRYKLNLTLEKMSPVLKGTLEVRVRVNGPPRGGPSANVIKVDGVPVPGAMPPVPAISDVPIILDWRKIRGHGEKSTVSNVTINGKPVVLASPQAASGDRSVPAPYEETNEHLVFREGVVASENVIKLDFTSPILTSGSAITRYVDKEDGSEYIYSLFVPSDASTAFPVFDQPDLKAKFQLNITSVLAWKTISNASIDFTERPRCIKPSNTQETCSKSDIFRETKPISTYVFAFAAGPFEKFNAAGLEAGLPAKNAADAGRASPPLNHGGIFFRKSQAEKFKPHAAEVFRLNREAVKYFEEYFDYKFPFPKYDLVLIPEFPFGGMEHAGATFLRESSIIFPQEPTKNDHINRATLIFHEAAHQWFGDTVTMRWFDDLWLKEGFATFTAYKAMEKIMPEMNSWKVFYERVKQGAYQTDSTKGTTPIYQEIKNLSAAKSAYGAIVYNKAPAFLRQAEFYLGEDKFQTAVRAFLKKHEFANAGWEDLVKEFESSSGRELDVWAAIWVKQRGMPTLRLRWKNDMGARYMYHIEQSGHPDDNSYWRQKLEILVRRKDRDELAKTFFGAEANMHGSGSGFLDTKENEGLLRSPYPEFMHPNHGDYGYGIFLLDEQSRDYVLKNIQNEKDPFLRSMMWGSLWDSVREGELDPREYVELVVKVLGKSDGFSRSSPAQGTPKGVTLTEDESTTALLLNRVGTAMNYYMASGTLVAPVENMLIERMQNAETLGQRITFYRAFLNVAASENARGVLKKMLKGGNPSRSEGAPKSSAPVQGTLPTGQRPLRDALTEPAGRVSASHAEYAPPAVPLKTKDKFDIVTRLLILGDSDAPKLLAELERTETSDDAKRYAYAAKAGIPTVENKAKYWYDFTNNREISESWIEAAFGPWNSIRHSEMTLPYLQRALQELPNHKRNRKIFFVNGWLGAFIGGQRSEEALNIVNKFLADNPNLDKDLRLKILENVDLIERAVRIRAKYGKN